MGDKATYSLYGGKVKLEYGKVGRSTGYWVDGEKVLRVTEIAPPIPFVAAAYYGAKLAAEKYLELLREQFTDEEGTFLPDVDGDDLQIVFCESNYRAFADFADKMRKAPSDTADRDRGTEGHKLIEDYFAGKFPTVPAHLEKQWGHFEEWAETHSIPKWQTELKVFSRIYGYAGTCDFIGEVDGWPTCIDWKFTGVDAKPRDSYAIQTAAYVQAYTEEHGHDAPQSYKRLTLAISENGVKEHWFDDFPGDFGAFKSLLDYYRWQKGLSPQIGEGL